MSPGGRARSSRVTCDTCLQEVKNGEFIEPPCGDAVCGDCLRYWFKEVVETSDFAGFPPKCCTRHKQPLFPREARDPATAKLARQVAAILGRDLEGSYLAKYEEWETPDKTYCAGCGGFVAPRHVSPATGVARCPACRRGTCARCKAAEHPGSGCPVDEGKRQVEEMAAERAWAKCARCGNMIEHTSGCYHMYCHCGHDFCYLCGRTWRSCRCPSYMTELANVLGRTPSGDLGEADSRAATTNSLERRWRAMLECRHPEEGWADDYDRRVCMVCCMAGKAWTQSCPKCGFRVCGACGKDFFARKK